MKILFDQGVPVPLKNSLISEEVTTAHELNWSGLTNGVLISRAESAGYDVMVTTDQNLKYQQNLRDRSIAIVVLLTTSWPRIKKQSHSVAEKIRSAQPGEFLEIEIG